MLHTLSRSPYQIDLDAMLRSVGRDDAILLFQDGVTAALADAAMFTLIMAVGVPVYVLQEDVEARGLAAQISNKSTLIDYNYFVRLTALHPGQMAW
ncbi:MULTISPECIES: sulfurtransferase complex subunit TusB [Lonsdalea]|uniref:tRNA 2-thiouridine(34) synthase TusB n=2 Tax=Lonsdalea TaxID=1082702 RepID=A0ACD1J967_9GAMM|nr:MULTISPECIES: sulfurtransferase complex subunit TusB [Lonsdalea]OSM95901.1 tRNA 2-thiouridine(34) synthase TusB [Lonsdalea populi]OSN00995.1 tRNA 2-thiouridine(34) synthase TusB [Lonsdalea populi]QPQ24503.1 sulfurtransferase complex subunit TusB [Lonsdalea populi]RAT11551.1 tRNA 2-thiouridine(34) synthase TusB [Lonsdalea quercina]RAT15681.1 tRNA 2-thiouridine(34) synthase TusB [Lonsdalea quercina]